MDPKHLSNLPPSKRFRLMMHEHEHVKTQKPKSPISPSNLPSKKRHHSRTNPHFDDSENLPPITPPTPSPYCLPAKKRIWAFPPISEPSPTKTPLSQIDLNLAYTPSPEKKDSIEAVEEEEDGILCAVCESTDGDPTDPIVFCDGCDLMVHSCCYGNPLIKEVPEGEWYCSQCSDSSTGKAAVERCCCLCPVISGAMKPTSDGRWAHIVCALLVPEVFFKDPIGRDGIDCSQVPEKRWRKVCYLCKKTRGCVLECSEPKCPLSFHVTCGLKEELCIELKEGRNVSGGGIVAGFCKKHTEVWMKQQQTGKFKIVARDEAD